MFRSFPSRCLASLLLALAIAVSASAEWKESLLYSFEGIPDGSTPAGGVVFDPQGNLYGTTMNGGSSSCPSFQQCGTVFEILPPANQGDSWTETVLYVFRGNTYGDGASPFGGLIIDSSGNLYGTTGVGGTGSCSVLGTLMGCGTVYELSPPTQKGGAWTETVLYSFQGDKDGQLPWGSLAFDSKGNLFGVTQFGGGYGSCDSPYFQHCGTIFELSPPKQKGGGWTEKVLYSFKGGRDGANPNGGLIFDKKAAIYGTTAVGGNAICKGDGFVGCGTAFELQPPSRNGGPWIEKILHRFKNGPDGGGPNGNLILDARGFLYGTAGGGGTHLDGVVFRLDVLKGKGWTETVLYDFTGLSDGLGPSSGLVFDAAGDLYGTALGGTSFRGVVYRLKKTKTGDAWALATLYNFNGPTDGHWPEAGVVFGKAGDLYGTTVGGGTGTACTNGCGTVFELTP